MKGNVAVKVSPPKKRASSVANKSSKQLTKVNGHTPAKAGKKLEANRVLAKDKSVAGPLTRIEESSYVIRLLTQENDATRAVKLDYDKVLQRNKKFFEQKIKAKLARNLAKLRSK